MIYLFKVRINNPDAPTPHFTTGLIGKDNAIARHGIHGLYWFYSVAVSGSLLEKGRNVIFLSQTRGSSPFYGIMYDYIRLEQPPETNWSKARDIACNSFANPEGKIKKNQKKYTN